jgi:membrane protease YdiL (CAAX protease family)
VPAVRAIRARHYSLRGALENAAAHLTHRIRRCACCAVLFSTAHLPNFALAVATLAWGIVSCTLFLRHRNLYALGLVHGILGLCVAISVPDVVTHHMMVGLGYLHYRH